jgi:ribose 5-phosphate isomerase B
MERIIIAADHAGFRLKEEVKSFLSRQGWIVVDEGTVDENPVDYADYAAAVAGGVSSGRYDRGILVCGSGAGMAIVANKFPGVRAALSLDEGMAALSRRHNDSNILVLAGRMTASDAALKIVTTWLQTPFEGGRHQRRLDKIKAIEQELLKQ